MMKWFEVLLTPLVVAVVGVVGTAYITYYQRQGSDKVANAQLHSVEERARAELDIEALKIFSEQIFTGEKSQQLLAVQLLGIAAPRLRADVAAAVARATESNQDEVYRAAEQVAKSSRQAEIDQLVTRFSSEERRKASERLIEIYREGNDATRRQVIDALLGELLPSSVRESYRVNLYVARTLGRLRPNWTGSPAEQDKIEALKRSSSYKDPTFRDRVDAALRNFRKTSS